MLNWDDYNESEKAPKPQQAKPEIEQPAPESIIEEAQEQVVENLTPVESGDRAQQAKDAIQSLDTKEGEEELEVLAGRVQVDDKAMINCRADLNQLVPFKYDLSLIHI